MSTTTGISITEGYWTKVQGFAPASIDWCEPNYVHSPFIAEWFNTWSNIPAIVLAVVAYWLGSRKVLQANDAFTYQQPTSVLLSYLVPVIVYSGSFIFHASLTYFGQLLDEVPMVYGILYLHNLMDPRSAIIRRRFYLFIGTAITVVMYIFRESPLPLQVCYTTLVSLLIIRSALLYRNSDPSVKPVVGKVFFWAAVTYISGTMLWLIERLACEAVQPYQFHALWHILTGFGTNLWIQFGCTQVIIDYHKKPQAKHTISWFGFPFTTVTNEPFKSKV